MPVDLSLTLLHLGACSSAYAWASSFFDRPNGAEAAWNACQVGEWLFWVCAAVKHPDQRVLETAAIQCVRLILPEEEDASNLCVDGVEAYLRGDIDSRILSELAKDATILSTSCPGVYGMYWPAYAAARVADALVQDNLDRFWWAIEAVSNAASLSDTMDEDVVFLQCADILRAAVSFESVVAAYRQVDFPRPASVA